MQVTRALTSVAVTALPPTCSPAAHADTTVGAKSTPLNGAMPPSGPVPNQPHALHVHATSARYGRVLNRMPFADGQGKLSYRRTVPASAIPGARRDQFAHVHVVLRGIDADDNGRYGVGGLDVSTFEKILSLPGRLRRRSCPRAAASKNGGGAAEPGDGEAGVLNTTLLALRVALVVPVLSSAVRRRGCDA